jgi:drug/metabolite transporter (DMT)-like permease
MYFGHVELGGGAALGLAAAGAGTLANASSALLGRSLAAVARERLGGVLPLTALSMAVGGATLLAVGLAGAGPPTLSPRAWAIVGWLALVNTAAAFTLWNHTLKTLSAVESSALNNTMLIQIAALAWIFLDQPLDGRQIVGLALAAAGALLVQLGPAARPASGAARPT